MGLPTDRDTAFKQAMQVHFSAKEDVALLAALDTLVAVSKSEAASLDHVAAYQGFDPRTTLKRFYELSQKSPCPPNTLFVGADGIPIPENTYSIEYAPEGGDPQFWWIPKLGHFRLDLLFFVGLYATRGTDISKIALRSTTEMSSVIIDKAKTYQIKGKKTKAKKGKRARVPQSTEIGGEEKIAKEEITLARLASCVPHLVCDYYKAGVGRVLVVFPESQAILWKEFPTALKHNVLAAVWPNHDEVHWPKEVTYLIAYFIDRRVNPDAGQDLSTITLYQDIALYSDFFSKTMRLETMKAAGVPMEGDIPIPTMSVLFREMRLLEVPLHETTCRYCNHALLPLGACQMA